MDEQKKAINDAIEKTLKELEDAGKPTSFTRAWTSPEGYRYLVQWSNAVLLRYLVRLFTNSLPKAEYRRKSQLDDCARSVVRNMEEGFKRSTTRDYLNFIGYSQGSLEEVKGDIRELNEDTFLPSVPESSLKSVAIDLKDFHESLEEVKGVQRRDTGEYYSQSLTVLYPPLIKVKATDLTLEIFMELIYKTDFLLRKLVISLEKKQHHV